MENYMMPRPDNQVEKKEDDENWTEVVENFDDMNLKEGLLRGIYGYGFEKPSAVQSRAIIPCLTGKDVIVQAQSGTGKTATFSISVLQRIDTTYNKTQAIILSPTRELAQQSHTVINALGDYLDVYAHLSMGGTRRRDEMEKLAERNPHVIVGTPGRVKDLIEKGAIKVDQLRMFVIDEADEMLDKGFQDQFRDILCLIPERVQILLLSATMPQNILDVTQKFMNEETIKVLIKKEEVTLEGIQQWYVNCEQYGQKMDTLNDLYELLSVSQSVVFVNTKREADNVHRELNAKGHTVSILHGTMDMEERKMVMKEFRSGSSRVLITTDILARGIDVQQVSLVFNYDLPTKKEQYIHRIGRSGRFGRKGTAINFVVPGDDERMMQEIQHHYQTKVQELPSNFQHLI